METQETRFILMATPLPGHSVRSSHQFISHEHDKQLTSWCAVSHGISQVGIIYFVEYVVED